MPVHQAALITRTRTSNNSTILVEVFAVLQVLVTPGRVKTPSYVAGPVSVPVPLQLALTSMAADTQEGKQQ